MILKNIHFFKFVQILEKVSYVIMTVKIKKCINRNKETIGYENTLY